MARKIRTIMEKTIPGDRITIIPTSRGFHLRASITFEYPLGKKEKFQSVVTRFDEEITQTRNEDVSAIAKRLGAEVEFSN